LFCAVLLLACCAGCLQPPGLSTEYGRSAGSALSSVNGTSALAKLFRQSGHRVSVSRRLGDLVENADVVVWVPNDSDLPRRTVTRYFDSWLTQQPGRRLIYVVKDYQGALDYWQQMAATSPDDVVTQRELARAITRADVFGEALPLAGDCDWFRLERTVPSERQVDGGDWKWLFTIDDSNERRPRAVTRTHIFPRDDDVALSEDVVEVSDRWIPLLSDGDQTLVAEYRRNHWGDSRVVAFSSGAWLLNLPLAKPDNRLIAEQLVNECASANRIVFLETGADGPTISDGKSRHHALEAFTVRPFNSILLHLTVLGMFFCCAVFPIFGRPQPVVEVVRSDFRRHVVALGELLARTGDVDYARARRDYYWTKVRRDSGQAQTDDPSENRGDQEQPVTVPQTADGNPFAPVSPAVPANPTYGAPPSADPMISQQNTASETGSTAHSPAPPPPIYNPPPDADNESGQ
jgi:hypothetical protein